MQEQIEEAKLKQAQILKCTQEGIDEIEYKLNVALNEASKWTDYTYQTMQYIQQRSNNEVSF